MAASLDGVSLDSVSPDTVSLETLSGNSRRHRKEAAVRAVMFCAAAVSLAISALIVFSLVREAWVFITEVEWSTVWGSSWAPRLGRYDIKTLVVGSLLVTVIAMAVSGPVGLGAAIYLSEYASTRVRKVLKPTLEILAGIPSVVLGFFALQWISPNLIQRLFDGTPQFNMAAAGIGVGILTIPLMSSIAEDALKSVPNALREASAGLGAKKVTTTIQIVLPAAVSGLVAALIVTLSRAIGETMVVFIAAGGGGNNAQFTLSPLESGSTMTAAMAAQASGTDSVVGEALTFQSLFFVGLVLFVITMVLNIVAGRFVRRVRTSY